jgi:hypothetical protein
MLAFFQWARQLVQPSASLPTQATSQELSLSREHTNTQHQIVAQKDVYHHSRPVLLLKSGQDVQPKTLASLHHHGIPVVNYCALKQPDGSLIPLDHSTLRGVLAQHHQNEQFNSRAMDQMLDLQARRGYGHHDNHDPLEPEAWQRYFKVLVLSDSVVLQEKVRHILEKANVLPQQIRPVMHGDAFPYSYQKYQPTCLIFDETTYRQLCREGFDLIQFVQNRGGGCIESMVCLTADSHLAPSLSLEDVPYHVVIHPVHRQSLMSALEPLMASIKRSYSNTLSGRGLSSH